MIDDEKNYKRFVRLDKNFFRKISESIKKLQKNLENLPKNSKEYVELKLKIDKINEYILNLEIIRIKKIIELTIQSFQNDLGDIIPKDNLTVEEEVLSKIIYNALIGYKEIILNKYLNGENPNIREYLSFVLKDIQIKEKKPTKSISMIVKPMKKIVGSGLKVYGPFKEKDIIILDSNFSTKLENIKVAINIIKGYKEEK